MTKRKLTVAVTSLFLVAFTFVVFILPSADDHNQSPEVNVAVKSDPIDPNVARVVIVGQRMTLFEKIKYDLSMLTLTPQQPVPLARK